MLKITWLLGVTQKQLIKWCTAVNWLILSKEKYRILLNKHIELNNTH